MAAFPPEMMRLLASSDMRCLSRLERAVVLACHHNVPQRVASSFFMIPRATLQRAITRARNGEPIIPAKKGRPSSLTPEDTIVMLEWIEKSTLGSNPPTVMEITEHANAQHSRDDDISKRTIERWISDHEQLTHTTAKPLEPIRIASCAVENVEAFFDRVQNEIGPMANYDPRLIFNFDESMATYKERKMKVITFKDYMKKNRLFKLSEQKDMEHTTIGLTISAAGQMLNPLVILPRSELPEKTIEELALFFPEFWVTSGQVGWIDSVSFGQWARRFVIEVDKIRERENLQNQFAILYLDGHSTHGNVDIVDLFRERKIHMVIIPSHTTHVLQPLDCGIFKTMKNEMMKKKRDLYIEGMASGRRRALLFVLKKAIHVASYEVDLKRVFETTGLFPWNFTALFIGNQLVPSDHMIPEVALSGALKRKRTTINISGQVLTGQEMRDLLIQKKEAQEQKEKEKNEREEEKREKKRLKHFENLKIRDECKKKMIVHGENWFEHCSLTQLKGILQLYDTKFKSNAKKVEITQLVRDAKIDLNTTIITSPSNEMVIIIEPEEDEEDDANI